VTGPFRCTVWVVLLAGVCLFDCSRNPGTAGESRPKSRSAPSHASSAREDDTPVKPNSDPSDASHASSSVPKGYVPVSVVGVTSTPAGAAVLLLDDASRRVVPIFVAGTEALSIDLRLEHKRYARPLTHDLLDAILNKVGATVTSVRVEKLEEGTYYATILMDFEGKQHELDARSSDAIAVALGHGAPILVAAAIVAQAGVSVDSLEDAGALDGGSGRTTTEEGTGDITL
jgi:bifunctional DNase/RNase